MRPVQGIDTIHENGPAERAAQEIDVISCFDYLIVDTNVEVVLRGGTHA